MDGLKEVFTALQERIKTPVIGSIILATIVINWKAFYVLIFTKEYYENKFEYMINNTYWWSLTILPILVGFAMVWVAPRFAIITAKLIAQPKLEKKELEINQTHKVEKLKEENKANLEQFILREKVRQAKIIKTIEDDELRDDAKKVGKEFKEGLGNEHIERLRGLYVHRDYLTKLHSDQIKIPINDRGKPTIEVLVQDIGAADRKISLYLRNALFLKDKE